MQWTGLNELREKYLSFFESKGHLRLDSFPLVPKNDPSLLLINSGMAPMKKWFLAQEEPPRHRVTTCCRLLCVRCWATMSIRLAPIRTPRSPTSTSPTSARSLLRSWPVWRRSSTTRSLRP